MVWIKRFLILALVALVAIQFVPVDLNEDGYGSVTPFLEETKPTAEVESILKETCFDCHSDQTQYPWYASVAPVNFWLEEHIEDGKRHLNFSEWDSYSAKRKDHKLDELIEEVEEGEMPLESYTYIHENANLSAAQIAAMVRWATAARTNYSIGDQPQ
ncbi:MAG: heme-binding domain-containing protein [Leeuwenhoekiella sp.]